MTYETIDLISILTVAVYLVMFALGVISGQQR